MNIFNKGVSIMKENKVKAVHDDDLVQLLQSLNVYEDVINKKCKCLFCKELITLDNIDSIVPYDNEVCFTCDKDECHKKLISGGIEWYGGIRRFIN